MPSPLNPLLDLYVSPAYRCLTNIRVSPFDARLACERLHKSNKHGRGVQEWNRRNHGMTQCRQKRAESHGAE